MLLQASQDLHQLFHFSLAKGAGGLVQDQDPGIFRERLGDLDHLHFAHPQGINDRARIHIQLVFLQDIARIGIELVPIDQSAFYRFLAQEDIFAHSTGRHQGQFLVNDGNPLLNSFMNGTLAEFQFFAVVYNVAFITPIRINAGKDLH